MKKIFSFATPLLALAFMAAATVPLHGQQYGGPPPPPPQQGYQDGQRWDAPPPDFDDVNRRAFHDGMDAAHNDWQSRRPLDAHRSMMFRRPPTDRMHRDQYRDSFARGYQVAVEHRDRWADHDHDHWDHHDHDQNPR
jgi:hypothetical protein